MGALDIVLIVISTILLALLGVVLLRSKNSATDSLSDKKSADYAPQPGAQILETRLKMMQLDLEQALEESQRLKEKVSALRTENRQLEDEIENQSVLSRNSLKEFEEERKEIENLRARLDKAIDAHALINEILNAEPAAHDGRNTNLHKVDSMVDYISGTVRDVLSSAQLIPQEELNLLCGSELQIWAATARKSWLRGKTAIAFIGEFSSGKTSIVNRILTLDCEGAPELPVDVRPSTAVATYITGGTASRFCFVNLADKLKEISEATFRRVTKEAFRQFPGASELIRYFVLTYVNPNIDNISILDTPGFCSNDEEDSLRTLNVINECDVLFWVVDVNTGGLNAGSVRILKEHLSKPLYVIINKADTKSDSDIDAVENEIRETLIEHGIDFIDILRFSKEESIREIIRLINRIGHNADYESYIGRLQMALEKSVLEIEERTRQAHVKANSLELKRDSLRNQYGHTLRSLHKDCQDVANIPQQNHRFLRESDYRLSINDFSIMVELLNRISVDHNVELRNGYQRQMEVSAELAAAWDEHSRLRNILVNLRRCKAELISKSQNLTR